MRSLLSAGQTLPASVQIIGKGATVGSVIAMRDAVSPNAVGVDIGCGMIGVKTSLTASDLPDDLGPLRAAFESVVPVGFRAHETAIDIRRLRPVNTGPASARFVSETSSLWGRFGGLHSGVQKLEERARKQLGSLGGGNHFQPRLARCQPRGRSTTARLPWPTGLSPATGKATS